ncbi:hypothetical protein BGZ61DRAFT_518133 [Ilyonectria robusta]|uniref:uncharacterized protein n=1 Tax=Ilyonectria robusta TaxID=1079257 RepID=UPI001E8D30E5|nr:uncharacterized protein BGZ61DRAFT_518133 [Ilyonectria robusta]KAH8694732.1 hypothetical protein BGZ61DRAFT_518133 [Ilyonectria robusta]
MQTWLILLLAAVATAIPQPLVLLPPTAPGSPPFRIRRSLPVLNKRANKLITVIVGGTQDTFVPNSVQAAVGDVIQFQFSSGNHTVTQSSADAPCTPLQLSDPAAIHSGHVPYEAGQTTVGTFNMPVTSTDPTFFYCATGPHCQNGQIMVLNPSSDEQILTYSKLSTAAALNVDGGAVSGGTVGEIALEAAAFDPPVAEAAPPGEAPPDAPAETPAEAPAA